MQVCSIIIKSGLRRPPSFLPGSSVFFASDASSSRDGGDPFRILGVTKGSSYKSVKETFIKLAHKHHPDRRQSSDGSEDAAATFIRIRQAFEIIREGRNGEAEATGESQWSKEDLRDFMNEQTAEFLSFKMDHDTRKAVIKTVTDLSPGGLDRGGTWEMARMLAQREKSAPDGEDGPSVEAKQVAAVAESSLKRRKRR